MIEKATMDDAEEIFDIHVETTRAVCSLAYPQEIIESWIESHSIKDVLHQIENSHLYVLRKKGAIQGFVHFNDNEIISLYLRTNCMGKKLGRKLFQFASSRIKHRPVRVKSTLNSTSFYKHLGCMPLEYSCLRRNDRDIYVLLMEYF